MAAITRGSLVRAEILQDNGEIKVRPGVVTTVTPTGFEVVYGQGVAWPPCPCPVFVKHGSLMGKYMSLTKDTHFCDMAVVPASAIVRVYAEVCLPRQLPSFDAVAQATRVRIARANPARLVSKRGAAPSLGMAPAASQPIPVVGQAPPDDGQDEPAKPKGPTN